MTKLRNIFGKHGISLICVKKIKECRVKVLKKDIFGFNELVKF